MPRVKSQRATAATIPPPRIETPNFEAGVLDEPLLAFGGHHHHIDPKTGLALYGPYTVQEQEQPPLSTITVGIVGSARLVSRVKEWLNVAQRPILNDGRQPFLYPHFPGFSREFPFQCALVYGETWEEMFNEDSLNQALQIPDYHERLANVAKLYIDGIQNLKERQPSPQVVVLAISDETLDKCSFVNRGGEQVRRRLLPEEKSALRKREIGLQFLFPEMDASLGIEDDSVAAHHNLRRAIKAEAMAFGLPTQLILERSLRIVSAPNERRSQDAATKAWNFFTALYHKAGGHPWRLALGHASTCYVGISFYRERLSQNPRMRTSLAQAFTHGGDGFVLRGKPFEWDDSVSPSPHLLRADARDLMREVLAVYERHRKVRPERIIVHKSSRFWPEELAGFKEAIQGIAHWDLVAIQRRGIQFLRQGDYPPLRGTWVRFDDQDYLLYTQGYVPYLRTYPGMRSPQPQEIVEHHGTSPIDMVLREILALTKLNWNSADFSVSEPITLAFSRRVGEILAEMPATVNPREEYRFYM
jgi:hypothetical protein